MAFRRAASGVAGLALVVSVGCSGNPGNPSPVSVPPAASAGAAGPGAAQLHAPWDITGIIGSGQSLSVGAQAANVLGTTQPYSNLKLSLGAATVPPFDPAAA